MFEKKKQLDEIQKNMSRLVEMLEGDEFNKLKKDSEELAKTKELLSHVRFKIKDTRVVDNQDNSRIDVIVTYELPQIVLTLDENGNPNKNDFFYSTNMLNMISLEDMSKFQNVFRTAQARAKKLK